MKNQISGLADIMDWRIVLLLATAAVIAIALELAEQARLRKLLNRPCAAALWPERFPTVPQADIQAFLTLFTKAFAFDIQHRGKFAPEDQLLAIYQARYVPHLTLDDHLEFESLTVALRETYDIDLKAVWRDDLTLGELFALTRGIVPRFSD